jgi:hypothetical protein
MGSYSNVDDTVLSVPDAPYRGVALRSFDPKTQADSATYRAAMRPLRLETAKAWKAKQRARCTKRLKLRVFCLGPSQDGEVRVGIVPEGEEILICGLGLGHVARDNVCSAQLHVRQRTDRIGKNDAAMI